jgi:hypothetical protein
MFWCRLARPSMKPATMSEAVLEMNVVDDLDQLAVLPIEQVSWYVGFEFHCHRGGISAAAAKYIPTQF